MTVQAALLPRVIAVANLKENMKQVMMSLKLKDNLENKAKKRKRRKRRRRTRSIRKRRVNKVKKAMRMARRRRRNTKRKRRRIKMVIKKRRKRMMRKRIRRRRRKMMRSYKRIYLNMTDHDTNTRLTLIRTLLNISSILSNKPIITLINFITSNLYKK